MRMRRKKNLDARLEQVSSLNMLSPADHKGNWRALFGKDETAQLHLEIGCGKGDFIVGNALKNPDICYVAVEREPNVILLAMEKAQAAGVENVRFIDADAATLTDVFEKDEIDRIYLNFSDPWPPKKRHKRRLTHENYLKVYDQFLKLNGEIHQKTDNTGLFESSLCYFSQFGYVLYDVTFNLHATDFDNIMTEYERNFTEKGMNIYRCVARKVK
ncbi:MAG: tRNA (guanosine(46)-N7)-methyltransferase TrmB [Clostridia bacterium]|nr:tRNA (guanosine(46)-N7)-methyltransferase TrmB [Clostridia bacterium]MBQ5760274.1 tRNA (guanosine(46)-N7)-methyltransferase TrmB [Clostridia bacterium]